jgi:hypothetical protein
MNLALYSARHAGDTWATFRRSCSCPRCVATFDENSVPPWTRGTSGVCGVHSQPSGLSIVNPPRLAPRHPSMRIFISSKTMIRPTSSSGLAAPANTQAPWRSLQESGRQATLYSIFQESHCSQRVTVSCGHSSWLLQPQSETLNCRRKPARIHC